MKQFPNRLKFRKNHRTKKSFFYLEAQKSFFPAHGNYAIKSLESGKLNFKQIESCRKSIRRSVKKEGQVWIRVFTYASITKKGIGLRMGKGKGNHHMWICPVRKGQVICELAGVSVYVAMKALIGASSKLPFKTNIVKVCY